MHPLSHDVRRPAGDGTADLAAQRAVVLHQRQRHAQPGSVAGFKADALLQAMVVDLRASAHLDVATTDTLRNLYEELHQANVRLLLADVQTVTRSRLQHIGLFDRLGEEHLRLRISEAVKVAAERSLPD